MKIAQVGDFAEGYNSITEIDGKHKDMLMDFGIVELKEGDVFSDCRELERVIVLLSGKIEVTWQGESIVAQRDNCFDENLWCINLPKGVAVTVLGVAKQTEIAVVRTENEKIFPVSIYEKNQVRNEIRGEGTMEDCGRRIVRTAMDINLTPHSNIMFGEDVHYPGRWAGFPSHSHPQPEIYFYKFWPENGFGLAKIGEEGVLIKNNDTITIDPDLVHPQAAAPGYAMYFLWIIRHLPGDPYITPNFEKEYLWVEEPDAKYWPDNI